MVAKVTCFEDRQGHFIFVKVPGEYGRYVRTLWPVALVDCPACGSKAGVPCVGQYKRYAGSAHVNRINAAEEVLRKFGINVRSAVCSDGEHPILRDDVVGDDEPGIVGQEDSVVDLREYFK